MKHQPWRALPLVILALLGTGAATGCGHSGSDDDVPADAVARVGDTVITKQQARTFLPEAAKQAAVRKQVSRYLIVAEWVRRDAKREGVSVPIAAVESGLGEADAKTPNAVSRVEIPLLIRALTEKAAGPATSGEEIARYYRQHPNEYARPEVRYMRSVATDSRAQAAAARRALEQGQGWKAVIDRYSTSKESVPVPSGDMGVQPGEFADALSDAVYAAERDTYNGPVNVEGTWYVFELTVIDRLPAQSLAEVRETIAGRLDASAQKRGADTVQRRMSARYRPITICNEDLLLAQCENGPPLELDANSSLGFFG